MASSDLPDYADPVVENLERDYLGIGERTWLFRDLRWNYVAIRIELQIRNLCGGVFDPSASMPEQINAILDHEDANRRNHAQGAKGAPPATPKASATKVATAVPNLPLTNAPSPMKPTSPEMAISVPEPVSRSRVVSPRKTTSPIKANSPYKAAPVPSLSSTTKPTSPVKAFSPTKASSVTKTVTKPASPRKATSQTKPAPPSKAPSPTKAPPSPPTQAETTAAIGMAGWLAGQIKNAERDAQQPPATKKPRKRIAEREEEKREPKPRPKRIRIVKPVDEEAADSGNEAPLTLAEVAAEFGRKAVAAEKVKATKRAAEKRAADEDEKKWLELQGLTYD